MLEDQDEELVVDRFGAFHLGPLFSPASPLAGARGLTGRAKR